MRRAQAWTLVALVVAATAMSLSAPVAAAAILLAAGLALAPRLWPIWPVAAVLQATLLSLSLDGGPTATIGPLTLSQRGALAGLAGATRLSALLVVNMAVARRVGAARWLDGLELPPRITAWLGAVVLAAHDVGHDHARLVLARRLDGDWPTTRWGRLRAHARLLPHVLVAAVERAQTRHEALQLAGHAMPPRFVPIVAVAAVAAAGRLAFLIFPNVAPTYVVVFLGGVLFGARVGFLGGLLGMVTTDLLLSGLYVGGLVNAPAMGLVGVIGAAYARAFPRPAEAREDALTAGVWAASLGIVSTLAFSLVSDSTSWLLVYAAEPDAWRPLVVSGFVFNLVPALLNGVVFVWVVAPARRAFAAWREGGAAPAAATPVSAVDAS